MAVTAAGAPRHGEDPRPEAARISPKCLPAGFAAFGTRPACAGEPRVPLARGAGPASLTTSLRPRTARASARRPRAAPRLPAQRAPRSPVAELIAGSMVRFGSAS